MTTIKKPSEEIHIKSELSKKSFRIKHYDIFSEVVTSDNKLVYRIDDNGINTFFSSATWQKASKDPKAGAFKIDEELFDSRKKFLKEINKISQAI